MEDVMVRAVQDSSQPGVKSGGLKYKTIPSGDACCLAKDSFPSQWAIWSAAGWTVSQPACLDSLPRLLSSGLSNRIVKCSRSRCCCCRLWENINIKAV